MLSFAPLTAAAVIRVLELAALAVASTTPKQAVWLVLVAAELRGAPTQTAWRRDQCTPAWPCS